MRVEKSEGGRKRPVWTQRQSGHLQQGGGKRQGWAGERQGYRQKQSVGRQQSVENQFCDRKISKATRVVQTQNQVQRQDSSSQPELHLSGCGTPFAGTLGTQTKEVACRLEEGRVG